MDPERQRLAREERTMTAPALAPQRPAEPTIDSEQLAAMLGRKDLVILQLQREVATLKAEVQQRQAATPLETRLAPRAVNTLTANE
jgi:hypothetical protein